MRPEEAPEFLLDFNLEKHDKLNTVKVNLKSLTEEDLLGDIHTFPWIPKGRWVL